MKKIRIISLILVVALALALTACGGSTGNSTGGNAGTASKVSLSLGHTNNLEHHYQTMSESFKKIVEEKSGGAIEVNIFPAEQLGSGAEMLEGVKTGTQDIVIDPDAYLANYDPLFNVLGMPYIFSTWDQVKAFPNGEAAKQLEEAAKGQGLVILGWAVNGFRVITTNKPVNTPDDLKGVKIRVGNSKVMSDLLAALGCNPTPLSMGETYSGIQTGIVDAQENPTSNIIGSKFYEVQDYCAVTHHVYTTEPLIMNKAKFDSLTAEQQQILLDAGKEVCNADVEFCAEQEESDLKVIEEGHTTITYPDPAPFKAAVQPVLDKYSAEYGEQFTKLLEQLQKDIA